MKHLHTFESYVSSLSKNTNESEEINESALEIAGGIVLGIVGLKTLAVLAKTVFGTLKLKAMKDPEKLKDLATQIYNDAVTKNNKNPLQAALWCNAVKDMIDKGDIKDGFELFKVSMKMDAIDIKKVFEEEGFDLTDEISESED